jgi:hypothetical protein
MHNLNHFIWQHKLNQIVADLAENDIYLGLLVGVRSASLFE